MQTKFDISDRVISNKGTTFTITKIRCSNEGIYYSSDDDIFIQEGFLQLEPKTIMIELQADDAKILHMFFGICSPVKFDDLFKGESIHFQKVPEYNYEFNNRIYKYTGDSIRRSGLTPLI